MNKVILNWLKEPVQYLNPTEYNEFWDKIRKRTDIDRTEFRNAARIEYFYKTYSIQPSPSGVEIRIYDKKGPQRYQYKFTQINTDKTKDVHLSGYQAYNYINDKFKELNCDDDMTLYKTYSGNNYKEEYKAIKKCVPVQIGYIDRIAAGKIIDKCYKADVSSAFPAQIIKSLPTLHGCQVIPGRIRPDEDYPFAFYTKSHHMAIYKELDTRNFNNNYYWDYYNQLYDDSVKAEDDVTILCKTSEYSLKPIFEELYNNRKLNSDFKFYMNACIGFFHKNSNPILSPLAAVVIARCNNEMLKRCKQLDDEGNLVLFIATDSIVWRGKPSSVATNEKYLGSFTYEFENGMFFGQGPKAYQVKYPDGSVVTKYSGMKNGVDKNKIPFGELPEAVMRKQYILDKEDLLLKEVF